MDGVEAAAAAAAVAVAVITPVASRDESGAVVVVLAMEQRPFTLRLCCFPEGIYPHLSLAVPFVVMENRHRDYSLPLLIFELVALLFVWISLVRPIHAAVGVKTKRSKNNELCKGPH